MNLVFVSNLFPSDDEPIRGLDNATLLPYLLDCGVASIRAVGLRPALNPLKWGARSDLNLRERDASLDPCFVGIPYVPKIGSGVNHLLLGKAVTPSLNRLHRNCPIDAVLVSWLYPDGCGVAKWCVDHGIPFVLICQGSDAHAYLESPIRRKLILESISQSRAVITRSADLASRLADCGADRSKLVPIYNGIDTRTFFPGDAASARTELSLPEEGSLFLFVGNLLPVKNPLFLVEAWKRFSQEKNGTLVMLGAGPLESQIREAGGGSANLILTGRLGAEKVATYMRAADALCLTSHGEGVPNVVLEAFGCGLPVISTDVGGIGEVLADGKLGRLVPPGDVDEFAAALEDIVLQPPDRHLIGEEATRFSWESTATHYAEILRDAVSHA